MAEIYFEVNLDGMTEDVSEYKLSGDAYKPVGEICFGGLPVFDGYRMMKDLLRENNKFDIFIDLDELYAFTPIKETIIE